jgi:hypothetical protein
LAVLMGFLPLRDASVFFAMAVGCKGGTRDSLGLENSNSNTIEDDVVMLLSKNIVVNSKMVGIRTSVNE